MEKARYMDEEILKIQIAENSKLIDQYLKELSNSATRLTFSEKATA
jgi:hypothetical protein